MMTNIVNTLTLIICILLTVIDYKILFTDIDDDIKLSIRLKFLICLFLILLIILFFVYKI